MEITHETPIGEIATGLDGAIELFEEKNINYFFGGHKSLAEACDQANVPLAEIMACLEMKASAGPLERGPDWRDKTMRDIVDHIVNRQHVFIRLRLENFCKKASDLARTGVPRFVQLNGLIQDMSRQMKDHMDTEEEVVFPYLKEMERVWAQGAGHSGASLNLQGSRHMIASLSWKHEVMWDKWTLLRALTENFHPVENENPDFDKLCRGFEEFEAYIHQHGHLEDNILFRKAKDIGVLP